MHSRMQELGSHVISIDGDVLQLVSHGAISEEEMAALLQTLHSLHKQHGQSYLIADVSNGINLSASVRKQVANFTKRTGYTSTHTFVLGANNFTRALILVVIRTIELLSGPKSNLSFVRSLEHARARIAEMRASASGRP